MTENNRYLCVDVSAPHMPDAADPIWETAKKGELLEVVSGRQPFLATEFRLVRDDSQEAFFLRFLAEDDEVHSTYRMHEETLYRQDVFELFIAEGESLSRYREIEVSPCDLHFTGDVDYRGPGDLKLDMDWDIPGFLTRTRHHREEYRTSSVWRLPYAAFSAKPKSGKSWRMNAFRIDHSRRGTELQAWQATGEKNFHVPDRFGFLQFA